MNKIITALLGITAFTTGLYSAEIIIPKEETQITTVASRRHFETVRDVKDGDTIGIMANWSPYGLEWSVRVRGIDTPEKGHLAKCMRERELSRQATVLTTKLIAESKGKIVLSDVEHDKYGGRILADVYLQNGKSLATELINSGLARRYNGSGPKPNWCY